MKNELIKYTKHLPTCNINQNWDEAIQAMGDTPNRFRDESWNTANEEMRTKMNTCTCGLEKILASHPEAEASKDCVNCPSNQFYLANTERIMNEEAEIIKALSGEKIEDVKTVTSTDYHPEAVVCPSEEDIVNGINVLAKLHAKQSVGDWATGYITGAKYVKSQLKQGYEKEFVEWLLLGEPSNWYLDHKTKTWFGFSYTDDGTEHLINERTTDELYQHWKKTINNKI